MKFGDEQITAMDKVMQIAERPPRGLPGRDPREGEDRRIQRAAWDSAG